MYNLVCITVLTMVAMASVGSILVSSMCCTPALLLGARWFDYFFLYIIFAQQHIICNKQLQTLEFYTV